MKKILILAVWLPLLLSACSGQTYRTVFDSFDLKSLNPFSDSLVLESAQALNNTTIRLTFDEAVDADLAAMIGNYSITDADGVQLMVTSAVRDPANKNIIILTTAPMVGGASYSIQLANLKSEDGDSLSTRGARGSFTGSSAVDSLGPIPVTVVATSATRVDVTFNEEISATIAAGDFEIHTNSLCTSAAGIQDTARVRDAANWARVNLTTGSQSAGTAYYLKVTANGLSDKWGNKVSSDSCLAFTGYQGDTTAPTVVSVQDVGEPSAGTTLVRVIFSEAMQQNAALTTTGNYVVSDCSNGMSMSITAVNAGDNQVTLTASVTSADNGGTCKVTVSGVSDAAGNTISLSGNSAFFVYSSSDSVAPAVANVEATASNKITVSFSEPVTAATAGLPANYIIPGLTVTGVSCSGDPAWSCELTTSEQSDINYTLTVSGVRDPSGNTISGSGRTMTFEGDSKPYITAVQVVDSKTIQIIWNEALDGGSTIDDGDFIFTYVDENGNTQTITVDKDDVSFLPAPNDNVIQISLNQTSPSVFPADSNGNPYTFTLKVNDEDGSITDTAGNPMKDSGTGSSINFTGDVPPRLVSASQSSTTTVLLTFSEPIDPATATAGNFSATAPLLITGVSQPSANQLLLVIDGNGTAEAATITVTANAANIKDLSGNAIGGSNNTANFTYTGTDSVNPTITSVVSTAPNTVVVTFSEIINNPAGDSATGDPTNPATYSFTGGITATSVVCSNDTGVTVCTVTTTGMTGGNSTLTVSGQVEDLAGNKLGGGSGSSVAFTGTAPADTVKPTITSITVLDEGRVRVTFSESVDLATAQNLANYSISPSLGIVSAVRQADNSQVILTFATLATPGASYSVTINNVQDLAGNVILANSSRTFTGIDATGPSIQTLVSLSATSIRVTFSEPMSSTGLTSHVNYSLNGSVLASGAITCSSTTVCTLTVPGMTANASYTLQITDVRDAAGNLITNPNFRTFTYFAAPGTLSDLDPASDTGVSNSDNITTNNVSLTISGTGGPANQYVYIYDNGNLVGAAMTDGSGNWTWTLTIGDTTFPGAPANMLTYLTAPLADGTHNITYTYGNEDGTYQTAPSDPLTITIDTSGPTNTPSTIADLAPESDTGVSNTDNITNDTTPTLSGSGGTPGNYVYIYDNVPAANTLIGIALINSSGNWSWTLTVGDDSFTNGTGTGGVGSAPDNQITLASAQLSNGSHTITYTYGDTAGNQGPASGGLTIDINSNPWSGGNPSTAAGLTLATDSGVTGDGVTNNSQPTFTGSGGPVGQYIYLSIDGNLVANALVAGDGSWSIPSPSTLNAGSHTVTYVYGDVYGNLSSPSASLNLVIDMSAPSVSSTSLANGNSYIDITFSEGVWGGNGTGFPLESSDFGINFTANGGTATGVSIASVTTTAGGALSGGETTVRINLSVSGTPSGTEAITVSAVANSVFDAAGNAASFTTTSSTLFAVGVASIIGTPVYTPVAPVTGGTTGYIEINWSEAVYTNTGMSGGLTASDFTVTFNQNSGNSTNAVVSCVTHVSSTTCPGVAPAAGATSMRLQISNTGVTSGVETIRVNAASNQIFSSADGATPATVNTGTLTFPDRLAPVITNVTSSVTDGSYKAGDVISIQVVFSKVVNVSGTPQLTLATGTPATTAVNYVSGSGTNTLNFSYTVAANNLNADLDYANTSALSAGTSIRDASNNDANLTLPAPGAVGSLGANKNIYIDAVPPAAPASLALDSADDTGTSNNDRVTRITSGLTITGTAEANATIRIYLTNSSGTLLQTVSADGIGNWSGDISLGEGVHTIVATTTDGAGNVSPDSAGISITIDNTAPNNQNTVYAASSSRTGGGAVTIVSSGTASNEVWFAPAGTTVFVAGPTMTQAASGTATSINAPATAGAYKLFVLDLAGNISSASTATLTVENTPATVALTYSHAGGRTSSPFPAGVLTITATYSEALSSAPTISINQPGSTDITNAAMTDAGGNVYTYAYTINTATGGTYIDGNANVTLSATTDLAGNTSEAPTNASFVIDTAVPTVAITYSHAGGRMTSPFKDGVLTITATYSEALASAPTISIDQPGTTDITTQTMTNAGGNVYTYAYTVNTATGGTYIDGLTTVSLSATADTAGNVSAAPANNTFTIDTTAPSDTATTGAPSGTSGTTTLAVTVTGTDVQTYQFKVGLAASTDCSNAAGYSSATPVATQITSNISGIADGLIRLCVVGIDTAGNIQPLASAYSTTWTKSSALTVTVNQAGGQQDPVNSLPIEFTVIFSQRISTATFTTADITQNGTANVTSWTITNNNPGTDTNFTVRATAISVAGTVIPSIAAGTVRDFGDTMDNLVSTSTDNSVTYDLVKPNVTINQASGQNDPVNSLPINFTVVFSKAINPSTFTAGDITQTGTATGISWGTPTTSDNITWNVAATAVTGEGTLIPAIAADRVQDPAGNNNNASTSSDNSVTYDVTPPTALISGQPTGTNNVPTLDVNVSGAGVVFYQFKVGATASTDCSVASGYSADIAESLNITTNISALPNGSVTLCVIGKDSAGNYQAFASATTATWTKDNTVPTAVLAGEPTSTNNITTLNVTVSGTGIVNYLFKVGAADSTDCADSGGYSGTTPVATLITSNIAGVPDGLVRLCVVGINSVPTQQPFVSATIATWTKQASPVTMTSAETLDINNNGKIDHYRLTFSGPVNDSTFPGYAENALGGTAMNWAVAGYSNLRLRHGSAVTFATDTVNDNILYLSFDENSLTCNASNQDGCDTGAKPDLTTTVSTGLRDTIAPTGNQLALISSGTVAEADAARPVVISATPPSNISITLIYSEVVNAATAECGAGSSQPTVNCSTIYSISGGAGLTASRATMVAGTGINGRRVTLITNAQVEGQSYTLTSVSGVVRDVNNNSVATPNNTAIFSGAPETTTLVSAVAINNTTVELTFNVPVTSATAQTGAYYSIPGLTISSANMHPTPGTNSDKVRLTTSSHLSNTVNGYTLTISAGNIAAVTGGGTVNAPNNTATFTGDTLPAVQSVASVDEFTVDVVFSEPVLWDNSGNGALNPANYCIELGIGTANCSAGTKLTVSAAVSQTAQTRVRLTTSSQTLDALYTVTVNNVRDTSTPAGNTISATGKTGTFLGRENVKILNSARLTDSSTSFSVFRINFSKEVMVTGNNGVTTMANWSFPAGLNTVSVCTAADDSVCPISYPDNATGVTSIYFKASPEPQLGAYTAVAATAVNSPAGALGCILPVGGVSPTSCLKPNPDDRTSIDMGQKINIEAGPVYEDPFNDGDTIAAQVIQYNGKLYMGPNFTDSGLFQTDINLTNSVSIVLDADNVTSGAQPFKGNASPLTPPSLGVWESCATGTLPSCTTGLYLDGIDYLYAGCFKDSAGANSTLTGNSCISAGGTEYLFVLGYVQASMNATAYQSNWATTSTTSPFVFSHTTGFSNYENRTFRAMSIAIYKGWVYQAAQHQAGSRAIRWNRFKPGKNGLLTGTVTFTNASTAVSGSGTLFQTELAVGDTICYYPGSASTNNPDCRVVGSIASNTSLTLTSNWTTTRTNTLATRNQIDLRGDFLNRMGHTGTIRNGQARNASNALISIDFMFEHDNDGAGSNESQLYIANGGSCNTASTQDNNGTCNLGTRNASTTTGSDGGILRSVLASSTFANPPAQCTAANCDTIWEDVTPGNAKWWSFMSKALPQDAAGDGVCGGSTNAAGPAGITTFDDWDCLTPSNTIIPAIKAIPKMVTFNGDLYMLRNACSTSSVSRITASVQTTCGNGNEVPQLWRLNAGAGNTAANARAGWTLVAENGSTGKTNMTGATWLDGTGQATKAGANTEITMLVVNGDRLYVGYDNATYGINLWRTKSGVTRASAETDFEAVCQTGSTCFTPDKQFGFGGGDIKIFDAISVNDAGKDYVIISARTGVNPLRIYRTDNN